MTGRKMIAFFASCLVLGAAVFYFSREFSRNLEDIGRYELLIDYRFLLPAAAAVALTYLIGAYGWYLSLNAVTPGRRTTLLECVGIVTIGNIAKYVPGKVWSYAFQMYWLSDAGISRTLVLYVNLVNQVVALFATTILGLAYLALSPAVVPRTGVVSLLAVVLVSAVLFAGYHAVLMRALLRLIKRFFGLDIAYVDVPRRLFWQLYPVYLIAAAFFGAAAFFVCRGIGIPLDRSPVLVVMAAMLISDVIGFVAFLAPGGIGVKEGVMYLVLRGVASPALSVMLPIATRIVSMVVDVMLGASGLLLLRIKRAEAPRLTGTDQRKR